MAKLSEWNGAALAAWTALAMSGVVGCSTTQATRITDAPAVRAAATQVSQIVAAGESIAFESRGGPVDAPGTAPGTLTLEDAARRALVTHPDLQAALARVRAVEADVDQANLLPNPILNVGLQPSFGGKAVIDAGLAVDFVAFLTRPGRVGAAEDRLRAAGAAAVVTALDVLSDVRQRYASVQALDALMPILEARRQLLDRLLALAESRLRGGEGTRLDVTTLRAQRVELEVEIAEQRLQRDQERLALSRLIGQPSGAAAWRLTPWEAPPRPVMAEVAWIDAAMRGRPEIQAQQYELAALGAEARLAKFGILDGSDVGIDAERDDVWRVGPSLTTPLPIFDWGQARGDKALAQVIEVRHRLTQTRRQIVEDVRRAYQTFGASWDALERVRSELIPLQEQRREQAESQYKAGITDITALVIAEQDLQAARARLIELQRRTSSSTIGLERAVGGPGAVDAVMRRAPATAPSSGQMPATSPAAPGPR